MTTRLPRTMRLYFASTLVIGGGAALTAIACVPPGNSTPSDAGPPGPNANAAATPTIRPSVNVMRAPFEDTFDRAPKPAEPASPASSASATDAAAPAAAPRSDGAAAAAAAAAAASANANDAAASDLGPDWTQAGTSAWHIEKGRLCVENAKNHGVWLNRTLPINARIEFEATSYGADGDVKAELWGDGRSAATALSYTNATSYLTILGGWKNTLHVLARINEHGDDRKVVNVDPTSDDPRQKPVNVGQTYHFKVERSDGRKVRWSVDGVDFLSFDDSAPLAGFGHDHFGFNNWQVKVCYDNVKITPL